MAAISIYLIHQISIHRNFNVSKASTASCSHNYTKFLIISRMYCQSDFNLLDLPLHLIEKIFSYCMGSLEQLKATDKDLKDFIENSPKLRKIKLGIRLQSGKVKSEKMQRKKFVQFMQNNVKYGCVEVTTEKLRDTSFDRPEIFMENEKENDIEIDSQFGDDSDCRDDVSDCSSCSEDAFDSTCYDETPSEWHNYSELPDNSHECSCCFYQKYTAKMIVEKHAEFIDDFQIHLRKCDSRSLFKAVRLMENLKNLVKIDFNTNHAYNQFSENTTDPAFEFESENFAFPQLKELLLDTDLTFPFLLFSNCKAIEIIKIRSSTPEKVGKIVSTLESCKETLKSLEIDFRCSAPNFGDTLKDWAQIGLNLTSFSYNFLNNSDEIDSVCHFLKRQHLEKLEIGSKSKFDFIGAFKHILPKFKQLKTLHLRLDDDTEKCYEFGTRNFWKLGNLEKIAISCAGGLNKQLTESVFYYPSSKLKEIDILSTDKDFDGGFFDTMPTKYLNLTRFEMQGFFNNYSSKDIILILGHLKSLQILEFHFPQNSKLDLAEFHGPRNLTLPHIIKVTFNFNDYIFNDHLLNLMHALSNMREFNYYAWTNMNDSSFDIITKELPNLIHLKRKTNQYEYFDSIPSEPTLDALNKMKENIQKFNSEPKKFKFDNSAIDSHIDCRTAGDETADLSVSMSHCCCHHHH